MGCAIIGWPLVGKVCMWGVGGGTLRLLALGKLLAYVLRTKL